MTGRSFIVGGCLALAAAAACVDTSGLARSARTEPGDEDAAPPDAEAGDGANDAGAADGESGRDGDPGVDAACPAARGPGMVRIVDAVGTFCVDATEVTNAHYGAFLADGTKPVMPAVCGYKTTFGAPRPADAFPVTAVDWCDAWAFCQWAGKRLCGSRDGAPLAALDRSNLSTASEWYAACSRSGTQTFPYSGGFVAKSCNGCARTDACDDGGAPLLATRSLPRCEGGYPGVFDLSGNVAEWEDNCAGGAGASDRCRPRGGGRNSDVLHLRCAFPNASTVARDLVADDLGFRCCAP